MVTLNKGEIICPQCGGEGKIGHVSIYGIGECKKCYGAGKLDWIEQMIGKKEPPKPFKISYLYGIRVNVYSMFNIKNNA